VDQEKEVIGISVKRFPVGARGGRGDGGRRRRSEGSRAVQF